MAKLRFSTQSWICIPAAVLFCMDIGFTLIGQSSAYWQGNYDSVEEDNLFARMLLLQHPALFIGLAIIWLILFATVLLFWKHRFAIAIGFILTFGHTLGSASWLIRQGIEGKIAGALVLIAAQQLLMWSWRRAGIQRTGKTRAE